MDKRLQNCTNLTAVEFLKLLEDVIDDERVIAEETSTHFNDFSKAIARNEAAAYAWQVRANDLRNLTKAIAYFLNTSTKV
jgi:hypothetical protein